MRKKEITDNFQNYSSKEDDKDVIVPQKTSSKVYFFVIAIAALLATNVYFYIKFKSSGERLYTATIQKQDLQIEIDRIEAELDNLIALKSDDLEETDFEELEIKARDMINNLRMKLENKSISESDLYIAKNEVAKLKNDVSALKVSFSELKRRNELLRQENDELIDNVYSSDQKIAKLSGENSQLQEKVSIASALKVSNIQVNGVSESKKGKVEIETRARRVDRLQILYSIADNTLAEVGEKEVFVRVIDPLGNLYGDANNFFFVHGEKLQYTFKDFFTFTNKGEEYQLMWSTDKFKKGAYTILLYSNNAIMGRTSVVLR